MSTNNKFLWNEYPRHMFSEKLEKLFMSIQLLSLELWCTRQNLLFDLDTRNGNKQRPGSLWVFLVWFGPKLLKENAH